MDPYRDIFVYEVKNGRPAKRWSRRRRRLILFIHRLFSGSKTMTFRCKECRVSWSQSVSRGEHVHHSICNRRVAIVGR